MKRTILFTITAIWICAGAAAAQEATAPKIMVLLPERIDVEWYWYFYTVETQHRVQTEVEKALLKAGYELVDLEAGNGLPEDTDIEHLLRTKPALETARTLNADMLVLGKGEAISASRSTAYGLNVYRSTADITAKILNVEDGKVVTVQDVTETQGAESQRAAAHKALREGGRKLGQKLVRELTPVQDRP